MTRRWTSDSIKPIKFPAFCVMAVLVTAIHVFLCRQATQGVDGRNKSGHD